MNINWTTGNPILQISPDDDETLKDLLKEIKLTASKLDNLCEKLKNYRFNFDIKFEAVLPPNGSQ